MHWKLFCWSCKHWFTYKFPYLTRFCESCFYERENLTPRGFKKYGSFMDMYDTEIRVQQSSNVDGGIWVFSEVLPAKEAYPPHLSIKQAEHLIALLKQAVHDQKKQNYHKTQATLPQCKIRKE